MDRKVFCLLLLVCLNQHALPQLVDSSSYYIGYQGAGTWNLTGENSLLIFNNGLKLGLKKKNLDVNVNSSWLYGTQNKELVNNDFSSAAYIDLHKTWAHFNYWGLATYDRSYSLEIRNRYQVGIGGAYDIVDRERVVVNVSDGVIYEQSNINGANDENVFNTTLRNSFRLRYKFNWKDLVLLDATHFLQQSFANKRDYIVKSNSTLFIKLFTGLHLTGSVLYNRLNLSRRENLVTSFGFNLEKRF